jgi:hypothetical protein
VEWATNFQVLCLKDYQVATPSWESTFPLTLVTESFPSYIYSYASGLPCLVMAFSIAIRLGLVP